MDETRAQQLRAQVEGAPLSAARTKLRPLPSVRAPDLSGLRLPAPPVPVVSDDDLKACLAAMLMERAPRVYRGADAPIQDGDMVCVDLVGYVGGHVLPLSAQSEVWLDASDDELFPGLRAQLVGHTPGHSVVAKVSFPPDHAIEALSGQTVRYAVDIRSACVFEDLAADDPRWLEIFGVASTDALLAQAAAIAEAELQRHYEQTLLQTLSSALLERTEPVPIDEALIDAEIDARFHAQEGTLLEQKAVPHEDRRLARDFWRELAGLRDAVATGIIEHAMWIAIADAAGLAPDEAALSDWMEQTAQASGTDPDDIRKSMDASPEDHARIMDLCLRSAAVRWALEQVTWVEATDEEEAPPDGA